MTNICWEQNSTNQRQNFKKFLKIWPISAENWIRPMNVKANYILTNWQPMSHEWISNNTLDLVKFVIRKRFWSEEKQEVDKEVDAVEMNDTRTSGNQGKPLPLEAKIALATWLGVAGLVTIVGNGIVLWLISKKRSLRTMSNLFLTSLAAADFLVGLAIDPVWIVIRCLGYNSNKAYIETFVRGIDYLWIHTTVATTFNLCCVSLDRYVAIIHPLRYHDFLTNRRCYLLIANVWFMSLVLPCSRFMVQDITALSTLYISFTVMTILFPMSIIVFCSLRILKAALAHYNSINPTSSCEQNQDVIRRTKKNYKAAKTVSIIVGLFVVSWLPSLITGFVHYFNTKGSHNANYYTVWTFVETTAFTSSAINPWVYCLRNDEFYEALSRTFRFLERRWFGEMFCLQFRDRSNGELAV